MAKRTTVNYADTYIQALEPFHTGNPRGGLWGDDSSTVMHLGKLPEPYRSQIYGSPGLVYVVYSYQTPIAWVTSDGKTHIPDVKYSVTTTKHQHIARRALSVRNKNLCPECAHLVIRNYNVMPQRMWESDRQVWTCEHCGTRVVRYFQNSQWTEWRKL